VTEEFDMSSLDDVKSKFTELSERDPGEHWYDNIKLSQSISKKGKRAQTPELDALATEHFIAYLNICADKAFDEAKKKELSARYVNGLLTQGGPSTDVFKKSFGEAKTEKLFKDVLFGINE
jgi:hypothetical protein